MQVFALFPSANILELAITYLKNEGIDSRDIFVVPIEEHRDNDLPVDKRYPKRRDAVDKGFAFATGVSVITAGIGFKLTWGPIIWGIIGAIAGFLMGVFISTIQSKKKWKALFKKQHFLLPIIVIVNCEENIITKIETALYEKGALGVNTPLKKGSSVAID